MNPTIFYPKLGPYDLGCVRIGGPGLANCLFMAAHAYVDCSKNNGTFVDPTWRKLSVGPILRHEKDKRVYNRLFHSFGAGTIRKFLYQTVLRNKVQIYDKLDNYFSDFNADHDLVMGYLNKIIRPETIQEVTNKDSHWWDNVVAIHVRLGDYSANQRIPLEWYKGVILNLMRINPNLRFLLFSDGTDEELKMLTSINTVERAFFGNAFADMWAISKCRLLIASDSTFSAWGAFMGRVPILFNRRHFPSVYQGDVAESTLGDSTEIPQAFVEIIKE